MSKQDEQRLLRVAETLATLRERVASLVPSSMEGQNICLRMQELETDVLAIRTTISQEVLK